MVACWISEPLIFRTEDAGFGLPLPCLPSSATTRSWVISSAFSSISTAASFSRKRWSSIIGLPPDSTLRGELLDAAQPLLGDADAGDAGALVAEQEFGVVPALVLLADQVLDRHLDVVEEHLVDLVAAVDGLDRAHRDALRLHVDQDEGDAHLLLRIGVGAAQAEDQSACCASVVQVFWPLTT